MAAFVLFFASFWYLLTLFGLVRCHQVQLAMSCSDWPPMMASCTAIATDGRGVTGWGSRLFTALPVSLSNPDRIISRRPGSSSRCCTWKNLVDGLNCRLWLLLVSTTSICILKWPHFLQWTFFLFFYFIYFLIFFKFFLFFYFIYFLIYF